MSGLFVVCALPGMIASLLRERGFEYWDLLDSDASLDERIAHAPDEPIGVWLSGVTYFPDDAAELESYRRDLLTRIPITKLRKLVTDPRGVLVCREHELERHSTYDAIVAAALRHDGFWLDPSRPATAQDLPFGKARKPRTTKPKPKTTKPKPKTKTKTPRTKAR